MKKLLSNKRGGYAISFEVMITLALMTYMIMVTFSMLNAFNVQRYMSTIMTSTASAVAKIGGTNTKAAALIDYNPVETANTVAHTMIGEKYNVKITASPTKVVPGETVITVNGEYTYPIDFGFNYLFSGDTIIKTTIQMESLMRPGALL